MVAAGPLSYQAYRDWLGPEGAVARAFGSVFVAFFGVISIAAVAVGVVAGSAPPVIFGIFVSGAYGSIIWNWFHLASRLEFSDGCLSWWCSLPWSPRMRPGRVTAIRWPASARGRYLGIELDDGRKLLVRPGPGLMEFITGVQQAEPLIVVDLRPGGRGSKWMNAEPAGYLRQRVRAVGGHRSVRILVAIIASLAQLGVVADMGLTLTGPQETFQTLHSDLAHVRLPSGYHLAAQHQAGTDCHDQCSITQTWAWAADSQRTRSAVCTDVYHAMTSAFSGVDSNSPIPADDACDYFAILGDLLHPGQGKRSVEAFVQTGQNRTSDGFLIELTASYG